MNKTIARLLTLIIALIVLVLPIALGVSVGYVHYLHE
jgi:hypothetical protein